MQLLFLLWPKTNFSKRERRQVLLDQCAAKILTFDVQALRMNIDDELSTVKSPAPKWYDGDALIATISIETRTNVQKNVKDLLENSGFIVGAYKVDQSIYKDYGDNQHYKKRDWADGKRSPTEQAVTLLTRPKKFTQEEWIKRWHGNMSPVSEVLQPRARYVRNVILEKTKDSPAFDGMVEEAWPTPKHITNPFLFYCAGYSPFKLIINMFKLLKAVMYFHELRKIRTVTMSEYFLKTSDTR